MGSHLNKRHHSQKTKAHMVVLVDLQLPKSRFVSLLGIPGTSRLW